MGDGDRKSFRCFVTNLDAALTPLWKAQQQAGADVRIVLHDPNGNERQIHPINQISDEMNTLL